MQEQSKADRDIKKCHRCGALNSFWYLISSAKYICDDCLSEAKKCSVPLDKHTKESECVK